MRFNQPERVGARPVVAMTRDSTGPAGTTIETGAMQTHAATASGPPAALHFTVRYTLGEYIVFMWQHGGYLIRRRRIGRLPTLWMTFKSTWAAAFHFIVQGRARHLYEFIIDEHGIVRTNSNGVTLVPWGDVNGIRRYSRGYMLVLRRGTLPIPHRCLDAGQAAAMDRFAVSVRQAARKAARQ